VQYQRQTLDATFLEKDGHFQVPLGRRAAVWVCVFLHIKSSPSPHLTRLVGMMGRDVICKLHLHLLTTDPRRGTSKQV
jgi:hypothetical protein